MPQNIGKLDRGIRFAVGTILVVAGMVPLNIFLVSAVGLLVFLSGVTRFCPLYKVLNISTVCKGSCEETDSCPKE